MSEGLRSTEGKVHVDRQADGYRGIGNPLQSCVTISNSPSAGTASRLRSQAGNDTETMGRDTAHLSLTGNFLKGKENSVQNLDCECEVGTLGTLGTPSYVTCQAVGHRAHQSCIRFGECVPHPLWPGSRAIRSGGTPRKPASSVQVLPKCRCRILGACFQTVHGQPV